MMDRRAFLQGACAGVYLPLIQGSHRSITSFTPEAYGAIGDGYADDAQALQSACDAAAAAHGILMLAANYRITRGIVVQPQGADQFTFMQIAGVGAGYIVYDGPPNGIALRLIGVKNTRISGLKIKTGIPGVTAIGLDGTPAHISIGSITFADCLIDLGTGGGCIGFAASSAAIGNQLDCALVNYERCLVQGRGRQYGDWGWYLSGANVMEHQWFGSNVSNCAVGWRSLSSTANSGGDLFWFGCGAGGCAIDFQLGQGKTHLIHGGRFENGQQLLTVAVAKGTAPTVVDCRALNVQAYRPPNDRLIDVQAAAHLTLDGCLFRAAAGYAFTGQMINLGTYPPACGSLALLSCTVYDTTAWPCWTNDQGAWEIEARRNTTCGANGASNGALPVVTP